MLLSEIFQISLDNFSITQPLCFVKSNSCQHFCQSKKDFAWQSPYHKMKHQLCRYEVLTCVRRRSVVRSTHHFVPYTMLNISSNDVLATLVTVLYQFWHKYKKRTHSAFSFWFRQRPTFPGSFPPSIIGTTELNFRVRDGNGCDLCVITTEYVCITFVRAHSKLNNAYHFKTSFTTHFCFSIF